MRSGGVGSDATVVGRGPVAFAGCVGQCACTHNLHAVECPREIWAVLRALLLLEKNPMVLRELIRPGSSIPVEAVKACALVGLHMIAEEDSWRMDSDSSFSSSSTSENNVGNGALFVTPLRAPKIDSPPQKSKIRQVWGSCVSRFRSSSALF